MFKRLAVAVFQARKSHVSDVCREQIPSYARLVTTLPEELLPVVSI